MAWNGEGRLAKVLGLALLAAASASAAAPDEAAWHDRLAWQGRSASMRAGADGAYTLTTDGGAAAGRREIAIAAQPLRAETASALFDGLFALAQQEMRQDQVTAIRDGAFDHGQPVPCDCYQTGEKWPYVWTRDLSYAADLVLARLDPGRVERSLRFKLSEVRNPGVPQGLYVAQDTGSGGSWPISTDRVVWFLAARHLLDDRAFADDVWRALQATLAQDRLYAFDADIGLYRGETSFLDWREQTYPVWTKEDVRFIAESFSLSTNVLHYEALRLAQAMATRRGDGGASDYARQAQALGRAIDHRFWNDHRRMYMAYIGAGAHPVPFESYELLGISLAALSGAVPVARAREALAHYPATAAGSPVVWPQQPGIPIYHNRAIWPFVSAYALRASRKVGLPARVAHEARSILRGAALAGSNMENYEFLTQQPHVDDGALSGPVVNSPRQLWSVAAALNLAIEGVFGVQEDDGGVAPYLPVSLVPTLFGEREAISLRLEHRRITLARPTSLAGDVLVADRVERDGRDVRVTLKAQRVPSPPLRMDVPQFAPPSPAVPVARREGDGWRIATDGAAALYVDAARRAPHDGAVEIADDGAQHCASATRLGADGIESLHGPTLCVGREDTVSGAWPRRWTAPRDGRFRAEVRYDNPHGPINTGVTAAVKRLDVRCEGAAPQVAALVMPHSVGEQTSTTAVFAARKGQACAFALAGGANMSDLRHFAHYTGGQGGADGALNDARVGVLRIAAAP